MLCRTWQVTCDKWHMTCFQNFSSLALMVWKRQCFEDWEEKTDWLTWFFRIYIFIERGQTDCIATTWPNQPSGPTCIFFTVAKTPKKCSVFKNIFLENGPTWGFSNSKTSVRLESQCLPYTGFFFNSWGGWGLLCQDKNLPEHFAKTPQYPLRFPSVGGEGEEGGEFTANSKQLFIKPRQYKINT